MRIAVTLVVFTCLIGSVWALGPWQQADRSDVVIPDRNAKLPLDADPLVPALDISLGADEFAHDDRAHFHPHGAEVCASGCAASNHPTEKLTRRALDNYLAWYAGEPLDETSRSLEALLYFGRQTSRMLDTTGAGDLDPERTALLRRELKRTHAKVTIRVVDEAGEVRANLPSTLVPLDRRHVFELDTHNLQPLVASGTVKRVGLYHLWTRL